MSTDAADVPRAPLTPVAARRMAQIVDAAARIVAERGAERLTTAAIAQATGLAIGSVYRYFPDRVAILVELGRRSRERLTRRLDDAFRLGQPTLEQTIDAFVDAVAQHYRAEPGVRSVGLGDRIDLGADRERCHWSEIAAPVVDALVRDHAVPRPVATVALETTGPMVDALVELAFRASATAEPTFLQHARLVARGSIRRNVG
ncbi:TetR/AcrR family transcriptional regulator [Agrococcus sp. GCM10030265]